MLIKEIIHSYTFISKGKGEEMNGLSDAEVLESRRKCGSNSISVKNENKFFRLLLESLGDPIIKIMLIALAVRVVFLFSSFDWYETLGMLISILLSSLISSLSEYGSNKSFKRLQSEYESIRVRVKRNNVLTNVKNEEIVVGDIVYLESGEVIPADGIIISGSIGVDESSINGEAREVIKASNDLVLKGSVVLSNQAIMRVKNVGINTIYGGIAKELNEKTPDSPMKLRLHHLAKIISRIGFIGAILVFFSYMFNVLFISNDFNMDVILPLLKNPKFMLDNIIYALTLAVTIIIVCVPEGLPMMVALVLSSNMKRMLKSNVLVRKLVGIETSGSLNVLLTDKTGTLTMGKLSVIGVVDADDNNYNNLSEMKDELRNIFTECLLYNNASYFDNGSIMGSNMTDKAILSFVGNRPKSLTVIDSKSFNSTDKYSYVKLSNNNIYYKGALEVLIDRCVYYLDKDAKRKIIRDKKNITNLVNKYTSKGIRVITLVSDNVLMGFILIRDEVRKEAKGVLDNIKRAGIDAIMITGDDALTAKSIAMELGMLDNSSLVLTHDDLEKLDDDEIIGNYKRIKVIARALPKDKSRVASVLETRGLVVGMTGDGVNDAPALKKANVGFAMGSGSEVAKEASDIVILDDNIASIGNAILYGRTIFKSIRKFIVFQLTMNFIALFLSIFGPFIGVTSPVTVMQMLWINMIMDTLAGLAYSYESPMKRYMEEKPIKKDEPILNRYMYESILVIGIYSALLLMLFLKLPVFKLFIRSDSKYYLTAFFSLFIFISIFNAFNARTTRANIFSGIVKNKVFLIIMLFIFLAQIYLIYFGGKLFRTFGLTARELVIVLVIASSVVPLDIVRKLMHKKR
ncbi:MAG: calcium-translocating P-type ATPase, PMCA-type [Bacilli bacterium]|nr:calcium-translocating P-type ATPase, PMCA-type [Bacilli bacterium]